VTEAAAEPTVTVEVTGDLAVVVDVPREPTVAVEVVDPGSDV
jgi:hypothetical protein